MEKTYKRVPFDLELAKKIQSGEVEGRIISEDGRKIRVMALDAKHYEESGYTPILILAELSDKTEVPVWYSKNGTHLGYISPRLVIELPEEAPKHDFKIGDRVRIRPNKTQHCSFIQDYYNHVGLVTWIGEDKIEVKINNGVVDRFKQEELLLVESISQHEFKPFDRVFVRNIDTAWTPALFSQYCKTGFRVIGGEICTYCIPYEGNEHLLGTTKSC